MTNIDDQVYFPALGTYPAELRALGELPDAILDRMVPILTLTRLNQSASLAPTMQWALQLVAGRPVIVDFDDKPKRLESREDAENRRLLRAEELRLAGKPVRVQSEKQIANWEQSREDTENYNVAVRRLASIDDGFASWRAFAAIAPNVIPVLRWGSVQLMERQVRGFSASGSRVAFRIDLRSDAFTEWFLHCSSFLDPSLPPVVILDAGNKRGQKRNSTRLIVRALDALDSLPGDLRRRLTVVMLAGSFSGSVHKEKSPMAIEEREIYDSLSANGRDIRYGDYASVFRRPSKGGGGRFYPHVEIAHPHEWHFSTSATKGSAAGYTECSLELRRNAAAWPGRCRSWGVHMVERAANGDLTDDQGRKMTIPGPWIGVRINQHLVQQVLSL